jgi:hypothetical protein
MKTKMNTTALLRGLLLVAAVVGTSAEAAVITVTPSNMSGWGASNVRANSSAAITNVNPRNGNGSVEMSLADSVGKADYALTWGYVSGRTLGSLNALSYDWYRAVSSNAADHFHPAFRLLYDADGNAGTTGDTGYLIYENIYNDNNVTEGTWRTDNILGENFWMRQFSPGHTVENFDTTLAEWIGGAHPTADADILSANTAILGLEFGIGSGWNGSFTGFVDNVRYGFGNENTTFNFETAAANNVPEPGSFALLGLGICAALAARKRKRA